MEEIIAIRIIRFRNRRVYTGTIEEWCELMNCNLVNGEDFKISDLLWAAEIFFDGEAEIAKRFNDSMKISNLPKRSDNFDESDQEIIQVIYRSIKPEYIMEVK